MGSVSQRSVKRCLHTHQLTICCLDVACAALHYWTLQAASSLSGGCTVTCHFMICLLFPDSDDDVHDAGSVDRVMMMMFTK